jgi:cobalamin biosynthesis Mg chelatase CobN
LGLSLERPERERSLGSGDVFRRAEREARIIPGAVTLTRRYESALVSGRGESRASRVQTASADHASPLLVIVAVVIMVVVFMVVVFMRVIVIVVLTMPVV